MNYFMKNALFVVISEESRGPDPHPLNADELLSRQSLFPIGLLSKKMRELVYLFKIPLLHVSLTSHWLDA